MAIPTKVLSYLEKTNIPYDVVEHKTVFTAYDLANTLKRKLSEIAKTLVVKADSSYVLVVLPGHSKLDFTKLKKVLKAKKVSLPKEKVMQTVFKVKPGAITAFGGVHRIPVVVDAALAKTTTALFGVGSFNESVELKLKAYLHAEDPQVASIGTRSMPDLIKPPKVVKPKKPKHRPQRKTTAGKKSGKAGGTTGKRRTTKKR